MNRSTREIEELRAIVEEVDEAHDIMMKGAPKVPGQKYHEIGWLFCAISAIGAVFTGNLLAAVIAACWVISGFIDLRYYRSKWIYKSIAVVATQEAAHWRYKNATTQLERTSE